MTEKQKDELKVLLREYVKDVTERRDNAMAREAVDNNLDDLAIAAEDILTDLSGWKG